MPSPTPDRPTRRTLIGGAVGLVGLGPHVVAAQPRPGAETPLDLALVLAVDASGSIDDDGWTFQLRGHAAAFRDPQLGTVVGAGPHGRIAVTLARFAGPNSLTVLVPWRVVANGADALAFADAIEATVAGAGAVRGGATALGSAVERAVALFASAPGPATRRTIDLSSNGFSNAGIDPDVARDRADAAGVTINALVILDEYDWLEEYYAENVIGGLGAFVRTAESRETFAQAILAKLLTEMA